MKDKLKSRIATGVVVTATVVLAGVAVFTAMRLYNLRQESVAPTAPTTPSADTGDEIVSCQELAFTITTPSGTPTETTTATPTSTATSTPTSTATPTATTTPTSTSTPTPTDEPIGGNGPTSTPTPTNSPETTITSTPTPTSALIADSGTQAGTGDETAQLPAAGISIPTIIAFSLGFLLILLAFVLAV